MAGTESDELMHQGVVDVLADYPDIEVVSEIYTNWNGSKHSSSWHQYFLH